MQPIVPFRPSSSMHRALQGLSLVVLCCIVAGCGGGGGGGGGSGGGQSHAVPYKISSLGGAQGLIATGANRTAELAGARHGLGSTVGPADASRTTDFDPYGLYSATADGVIDRLKIYNQDRQEVQQDLQVRGIISISRSYLILFVGTAEFQDHYLIHKETGRSYLANVLFPDGDGQYVYSDELDRQLSYHGVESSPLFSPHCFIEDDQGDLYFTRQTFLGNELGTRYDTCVVDARYLGSDALRIRLISSPMRLRNVSGDGRFVIGWNETAGSMIVVDRIAGVSCRYPLPGDRSTLRGSDGKILVAQSDAHGFDRIDGIVGDQVVTTAIAGAMLNYSSLWHRTGDVVYGISTKRAGIAVNAYDFEHDVYEQFDIETASELDGSFSNDILVSRLQVHLQGHLVYLYGKNAADGRDLVICADLISRQASKVMIGSNYYVTRFRPLPDGRAWFQGRRISDSAFVFGNMTMGGSVEIVDESPFSQPDMAALCALDTDSALNIDGDVSDWEDAVPIMTDPESDQAGTGDLLSYTQLEEGGYLTGRVQWQGALMPGSAIDLLFYNDYRIRMVPDASGVVYDPAQQLLPWGAPLVAFGDNNAEFRVSLPAIGYSAGHYSDVPTISLIELDETPPFDPTGDVFDVMTPPAN
ncbi:MAG: hypothetical protein J0M02_09445 [Planctomycetes bacterium]|nr:hypothetical protein [Planctomycetota bacterium]